MLFSEYRELSPDLAAHRINLMDKRWGELHAHEINAIDKMIQFLFLTNAGGAVAVLSFIGASYKHIDNINVVLSLSSFSLGVITVGLLHFLRLRYFNRLFLSWRRDTGLFVQDKLHWETMIENDSKRAYKEGHLYLTGVAIGAFFLCGVEFGVFALFFA